MRPTRLLSLSRSASRGADLIATAALAALAVFALAPAVGARFVLVDDHEILHFTLPGSGLPLAQLANLVTTADPAAGRLRPVYWLVRLTEMSVLGANPTAWHVTTLLLGLGSSAMLYATCRLLRLPSIAAMLLAVWLLVAPGVSSVWVRLGTNETIGMPFLAAALLMAAAAARRQSRGWEAAFVTSSLLAMLGKESFALLGPSLAAFRILADRVVSRQGGWPASALVVGALGIALTVVDLLVGASAGAATYGGAFLPTPPLATYATDVLHNLAIMAFAASGWLVLPWVWAVVRLRASLNATLWWATLTAALVVVPQVLLYSRQGIVEGKYELPGALGIAALVVATPGWLRANGCGRLVVLGLSAFGLMTVAAAFSTQTYAAYFAEDSRELDKMVQQVARTTPAAGVVAIAGDPAVDFEPTLALVDHFAASGRADMALRLVSVAGSAPKNPRQQALAQTLLAQLGQTSPLSLCDGVAAVIVMPDAQPSMANLACREDFEAVRFTAPVLLWGSDHVNLRPTLPGLAVAGYVVLERGPGAS